MKDEKTKCFTDEEIKQLKELVEDAVRHTLSEEDFIGITDTEKQAQDSIE